MCFFLILVVDFGHPSSLLISNIDDNASTSGAFEVMGKEELEPTAEGTPTRDLSLVNKIPSFTIKSGTELPSALVPALPISHNPFSSPNQRFPPYPIDYSRDGKSNLSSLNLSPHFFFILNP